MTSWIAFAVVSAGLGAAAIAQQSDPKSAAPSDQNTPTSPSHEAAPNHEATPSQGTPGHESTSTKQPKTGEACRLDDNAKLNIVLSELHNANQIEIQTGKIAAEKAQSQAVKDFANHMVKDHTAADQNLNNLIHKHDIQLGKVKANDPVSMSLANVLTSSPKDLKDASGAGFDALYMGPEPVEHNIVLNLIEQGQKSASNADVKKFLDDAHKMVSDHREEALRINREFRMQPTAVGGGPAGSKDNKGGGDSPMTDRANSERKDAGAVYPPSTTPPDLQQDQGTERTR
jgi:putative membrane protein